MPVQELSDLFCKAAKPIAGKQTDYFDTNTKGLCLTVSPGGTRTWNLFYTKPGDGKRARMKLGRYPELKLAAARTRAQQKRAVVSDGGDPLVEKRARSAALTVENLVENYIARKASTKRSGSELARRLRKNVVPLIGGVKLADLHRRDITRCVDLVSDRGARIEANRLFQEIRGMVRWARGRGDLDTNIVEGMRPPHRETPRDRVLDSDEIRIVWKALAEANMFESSRNILRLCLVTGQRVGEIAGMTADELDLERGFWRIASTRVKNGEKHGDHLVPLSDMAVAIIKRQMAQAKKLATRKGREAPGFVFAAPGGRAAMSGGAVSKAVKRQQKVDKNGVVTVMGVPPWTPHDLRRSTATGMEEIGVPPLVVGHVLNHVSVTKSSITSRVYARYDYAKEKGEALELWAAHLAVIIDGKANVVPLRSAAKS